MKKKIFKRMLAMVLTFAMVLEMVPSSVAHASLPETGENSSYNEDILSMITEMCDDDEEQAMEYYDILQDYGLLDDKGNVVDNWDITMYGETVTIDEIREILADESTDMSQTVIVDGSTVTLEDLDTMITIEDYLAYLEETYFTPHVWSAEQMANLDNIVEQINTTGIEIVGEDEDSAETLSATTTTGTDFSVDHDVVLDVSYSIPDDFYNYGTVDEAFTEEPITVTVNLSNAQMEDITFYFRTIDASIRVDHVEFTGDYGFKMDDDGLVTIEKGKTGSAKFEIYLKEKVGRIDGYAIFVIQLYELKNASFEDGTSRWEYTPYIAFKDDFTDISAYERFAPSELEHDGRATVDADFEDYYYVPESGFPSEYSVTTKIEPSNIEIAGSNIYLEARSSVSLYRVGVYDEKRGFDVWASDAFKNADATVVPTITWSVKVNGETYTSKSVELDDFTSDDEYSVSLPGISISGGQELLTSEYEITYTVTQGQYRAYLYNVGNAGDSTEPATLYMLPGTEESSVILNFSDVSSDNTTVSLSAPAGTYYAGQTIPILAYYDYPVQHKYDNTLNINAQELHPEGLADEGVAFGGSSANYLYTVEDLDTPSISLTGDNSFNYSTEKTDGDKIAVTFTEPDFYEDGDGVVISTPDKEKAITGVEAKIIDPYSSPKLEVTVSILDDSDKNIYGDNAGAYTQWLGSDMDFDQSTGVYTSRSLKVLYNGVKYPLSTTNESIQGGTLTASIDIGFNTSDDSVTHCVELVIDDSVCMPSKYTAMAEQEPVVYIGEDDISAEVKVLNSDGSTYKYTDDTYTIWAQDDTRITAALSFNDLSASYSFSDTDAVTTLNSDGKLDPDDDYSDFIWWIGDEDRNPDTTVANIMSDGSIIPTGTAGRAYVYLTALNGDNKVGNEAAGEAGDTETSDDQGADEESQKQESADGEMSNAVTIRAYTVVTLDETEDEDTDDGSVMPADEELTGDDEDENIRWYLTFDVGLTPFLSIPYNDISTVEGQDLTVYWTSNLCDKNGENPTEFTVVLTRNGSGLETWTVSGTAQEPASSITIPGEDLKYDYNVSDNNVYQLTVSSQLAVSSENADTAGTDDNSDTEYIPYEATARITVEPMPAVATLGSLDSYYILDTAGSVPITWTVDNFSSYSGSQGEDSMFLFLVTKDDGETVANIASPGTGSGNGSYTGSYTLTIDDVIADASDSSSYRQLYTVSLAAKNGTDSTWSYDSFLLYVYDEQALDIWINGETTDSVTLSNVKAISEMSQDEIIALNRDINLEAMVSINYGDYAWAELTDQIEWASENSGIATVGYHQGSLYENIEHYTYTSYRPTTEFGISGLSEGTVTITATHALTGMEDSVEVSVERLDNMLYLFQCYPQTTTTLVYTNGDGVEVTTKTNEDGMAAIYEESGIASDVYFISEYNGYEYLGTFYNGNLTSGEGDWMLLERYPVNNITLRRAAYVYMYFKNPDGTPYTGSINVRGGVYVDSEYQAGAMFDYNGKQNYIPTQVGDEDYVIDLDEDGKLEITMDQTQWGFATGAVNLWNDVSYIFQITLADDDTTYYPIILTMDASVNEAAYVNTGEAVITFRENTEGGKHPFVVNMMVMNSGGALGDVSDSTGYVGPSTKYPVDLIYTMVMWWGEEDEDNYDEWDTGHTLQLFTSDGTKIAAGEDEYTFYQDSFPFSQMRVTTYAVTLDEDTLEGILESGESTGLYLEYYKDGETLSRREDLPARLINMLGTDEVVDSEDINDQVSEVVSYLYTDNVDTSGGLESSDKYVGTVALSLDDMSTSVPVGTLFTLEISPTQDPTVFYALGQITLLNNHGSDGGDKDESQDNLQYVGSDDTGSYENISYWPGLGEYQLLFSKKSSRDANKDAYKQGLTDSLEKLNNKTSVTKFEADFDISPSLGGYFEYILYYDLDVGEWKMKTMGGGFYAGMGADVGFTFQMWAGLVPFTVTLKAGGDLRLSLDAVAAKYTDASGTEKLGNDFLTELRIYLYVYFFAGVGFDYSVIAAKIGVFGQIDLTMSFDWLNRRYLKDEGAEPVNNDNTSTKIKGQNFGMTGTAGIELVLKFLSFTYDQVLVSYGGSLWDKATGQWNDLMEVWDSDHNALVKQTGGNDKDGDPGAQDDDGSDENEDDKVSVLNSLKSSVQMAEIYGTEIMAISLAPTIEDVSYLNDGSTWNGGSGISTYSLDKDNGLASLNENSYAYADPVVTDDGSIVAFLGVPASFGTDASSEETDDDGISVNDVTAMYAVKNSDGSYGNPLAIDAGGYGDSQLSIAGKGNFAVAAWTRQVVDIAKDDGAVVTDEDQRMMLEGTDVYVSVYSGSGWSTMQIENGGADMAPVVATNGEQAIVAWRSVSVSDGNEDYTDFDQKDTILYKVYKGGKWGDTQTLYNGTSGNVKGLTAAMMSDGTAAVAYALDTDFDSTTIADREMVYAVINSDTGMVDRNVRATNDVYLDENPQLTVVKINGTEHFVLGWYTEQDVSQDAEGLNGSDNLTLLSSRYSDGSTNDTVSDIRLIDFDKDGNAALALPDSISTAAGASDVTISSDFAFTKGSDSIDDLSIVWIERADKISGSNYVEMDVLKAVKFYENNGIISFTGAIELAEMPDGTLVDHFDAYVDPSDSSSNTIKAVILGTTYNSNYPVEKISETTSGDYVKYTVPSTVSSMYTATETYKNVIKDVDFIADPDTIKLGAKTQIWFGIENGGVDTITDLTIQIGDDKESGFSEFHNIEILPGDSLGVYADYRVPANAVRDEEFTITATFSDGSKATYESVIYLNLPDIVITDAQIIREEEGERDILIKLNNRSDAALGDNSKTYVRLSFYYDAAYESEIEGLGPIDITKPADLKMIDEGGYSTMVTFNVGDYLEDAYGEITEIPDTGVDVYIKAEVIDDETNEAQGEFTDYNNYALVTCDNMKVRTGQDVIITSVMDTEGDETKITVNLQNTRLTETTTGNVIVTLIDADGNIIAQQQSYTGRGEDGNGLITLGGEEMASVEFTFTGIEGTYTVDVAYTDMILDLDEEEADGLVRLVFPSLERSVNVSDFVWDEAQGAYVYELSADDLTYISYIAISRDSEATITVNGAVTDYYTAYGAVDLTAGNIGQIVITVTNRYGTETTYILTVENNGAPLIGSPVYDPANDTGSGYGTTVEQNADGTVTVTIDVTAMPNADSYPISFQWYACDANGGNLILLDGETGNVLTVSAGQDIGVHYYILQVTRTLLNGDTAIYWSEVASVQITEAAGKTGSKPKSGSDQEQDGEPGSGADTGDSSHLTMWICLMAAAAVVIAGIAVYYARRRKTGNGPSGGSASGGITSE